MPLGYVVWLLLKPIVPLVGEETASEGGELDQVATAPAVVVPLTPVGTVLTPAPTGTHDISGHFEGKWFVHTFIATYADTNSVGNVYFGMYAMWVGKTRELFFNRVMPKFNLKVVTLEHEIFDSAGNQLGKGSQTLLFVSSTDYKMLDIPQDVVSAFLSYT